jgi:hypothetical protein
MANEIWTATIQHITNQIDGFRDQKQAALDSLTAAMAANDIVGILDGISTMQNINDQIKALKDRKALLQAIIADPEKANELAKADALYSDIVAQYQAKGLNDDLYADVARLKKSLRLP